MTTAALCIAVGLLAVSVQAGTLESLGQPCRAKNVLAGRVVADRADGRDRLVITNMNEDTGCELIFIDFEKDTGKVYHAPAGSGSWALNEVPGDRLVVGTFYDGVFMVFDLKKMEFVKVAKFPGEQYIWNLAMGKDGRIYGGSYPGGKLGALDLNTYEVEDCGAPFPPNLYLRNVSEMPDGRVFCNFIQEKTGNLIYDPATKKFSPVPQGMEHLTTGVPWSGYFLANNLVFDGKTLEQVPPPFPTPSTDKGGWYFLTRFTTNDTLYLRQGTVIYKYSKGDKDLTMVADVDSRGGLHGVAKDGRLLGVRGQDYFVIKPGDKEIHLKPIPVESGPRPTLFLEVDPRGRIWGGPHFGQTLFYMDPKTKKTVNTSNICDAGGEVYDVAFIGKKVYAVSYAGGDIVEYDTAKPWDQWNHKNPRVISSVGPRGYIRPVAGVRVGPDGKLYSGWMAKYGTYGGAVAITDPKTGDTELIENPLGEQGIQGVEVDDEFAYVGTTLGANGLPNKRGEYPKFGIIDLATKKVVFEKAFQAGHVRVLTCDAKTKLVALSTDGVVRLFNPAKREFVDLPADTPKVSSQSVGRPGDGKLYYGSDNSVVVLDLASGKAEKLAEAPERVTNVAVAADGTVYCSSGVDVYVMRDGK